MSIETLLGSTMGTLKLTKTMAHIMATTSKRAQRIYGSRRAIRKYQFYRTQFRFQYIVPKIRLGKAKKLKKFM